MMYLVPGICPPRQVISNRFFVLIAIALADVLSFAVMAGSGFGIICFQSGNRMRVRLLLLLPVVSRAWQPEEPISVLNFPLSFYC